LGEHQAVWDADGMGSGVYFVRLTVDPPYGGQAGGQLTEVRKVLLVK